MTTSRFGSGLSWYKPGQVHNDFDSSHFCIDRPPSSYSADSVEYFMDSLCHRQEVFRESIDFALPWNPEKPTASPHIGTDQFTILLNLIQRCSISGKRELFRQLLEQRYTVPLIVSCPKDNNTFYYYLEALRYIKIKLTDFPLEVMTDITLPRVAFVSQCQADQAETSHMIKSAMHCTVSSLNSTLANTTSAELGVGFLRNPESQHYKAWLVLHVRNDYMRLACFIKQFADVIVVEQLDTADNPHQVEDIVATESKPVIRWNISRKSECTTTDYTTTIVGNFNRVSNIISKGLDSLVTRLQQQTTRKYLSDFRSFYLRRIDEICGFDYLDTVVNNANFTEVRALQQSFTKECKLNLRLLRKRAKDEDEQTLKNEINKAVTSRRENAKNQAKTDLLITFVRILNELDANLRIMGLLHLENAIMKRCETLLNDEQAKIDKAWKTYQSCKLDVDALELYYQSKQDYLDKSLGLHNLWRELSHIYCNNNTIFSNLPYTAARHLLDGFSLEIMDGDAGGVNIVWTKEVLVALDKLISKELQKVPRVIVFSMIGVQSSGKSTILNTMFGCKLPAASGKCTRGVNIQLIKAQNRDFDYVLVFDTEGIRSPEFFGTDAAVWRDNRMATFAILPSNVSIITVVNEDDTAMKEVLPIVMLALKRSEVARVQSGRPQSLAYFVYNRASTTKDDQGKFQHNRRKLEVDLKSTVNQIRSLDGAAEEAQNTFDRLLSRFTTAEDEAESDVKYLGLLNNGDNPPNDTPNFEYGTKVVEIREYVEKRLVQNKCQTQDLPNLANYLEMVIKCIDSTDFELSFQTAIQYQFYNDMDDKIKSARLQVKKAYSDSFKSVEKDIYDAPTPPNIELLESDLEAKASNTINNQTQVIENLLAEQACRPYKVTEMSQWQHFLVDQQITWRRQLNSQYDCKWKYDAEIAKYEECTLLRLKDLWETNPKALASPEQTNKVYEEIFQEQIDQAEAKSHNINVEVEISKAYERERHAKLSLADDNTRTLVEQILQEYEKPSGNFFSRAVNKFGSSVKNVWHSIFGTEQCINEIAKPLIAAVVDNLINVKYYDAHVVQNNIKRTQEMVDSKQLSVEAECELHIIIYHTLVKNFEKYRVPGSKTIPLQLYYEIQNDVFVTSLTTVVMVLHMLET